MTSALTLSSWSTRSWCDAEKIETRGSGAEVSSGMTLTDGGQPTEIGCIHFYQEVAQVEDPRWDPVPPDGRGGIIQ